MTDLPLAIRTHLLMLAGVTTLTGQRISLETETPPAGYAPSDGACLCVTLDEGALDETGAYWEVTLTCRCYAASVVAARALYRALHDALHNQWGTTVRHVLAAGVGVTGRAPGTGWPVVVGRFEGVIQA